MQRQIAQIIAPTPASDGAGVRLDRYFPVPRLGQIDPFLLLDRFGSDRPDDYIAGFPPHPHRGFETVTYMMEGRMHHRDSTGMAGTLGPGGVQWMTAGRGIVHEEMPAQTDGRMSGFQLWVNLPARDKMAPPRYQNLDPDTIPVFSPAPGVSVRLVAGRVGDQVGAVTEIAVQPLYADITLEAGATFALTVPADHTALAVAVDGAATIGGDRLADRALAVLTPGETITLAAGGQPARVIVMAGKPLNEPVVRHGPFVMNTRAEIEQAIDDFRSGRF